MGGEYLPVGCVLQSNGLIKKTKQFKNFTKMNEIKLNMLWNTTSDSVGEMLEAFVNDYPQVIADNMDYYDNICLGEKERAIDWAKLRRKLKARHIREEFMQFILHKFRNIGSAVGLLFEDMEPDDTKDVELHMADTIEKELEWCYKNQEITIRQIMEYEDGNWIL